MYPSFAKRFVEQQKFTEEDQQIYNNHIIENFVESVNEMNDTVLIPSKLQDLDVTNNELNDDLYQYFRMINTVKKDLFEPKPREEANGNIFTPKRKISKALIQRKESAEHLDSMVPFKERKISSVVNMPALAMLERKSSSGSTSPVSSCSDLASINGHDYENHNSEVMRFKSSAQLTDQFAHHLRSMYTILDHFTKAAVYITEQYSQEIES